MALNQEELVEKLSGVLLDKDIDGLDDDLIEYLAGLLSEGLEGDVNEEAVDELMVPFLESVDCPPEVQAEAKQVVLSMGGGEGSPQEDTGAGGGAKKLKQGLVNMKDHTSSIMSEEDEDANRFLWGTDSKVHEMTNVSMETQQKSSAKDRRKAKQELEKARREFEAKVAEQAAAESGTVAAMLLPDYNSGRNERDVQIKNVTLSLDNGRQLLDGGELKFAHKRRYGLVGKVCVFLYLLPVRSFSGL